MLYWLFTNRASNQVQLDRESGCLLDVFPTNQVPRPDPADRRVTCGGTCFPILLLYVYDMLNVGEDVFNTIHKLKVELSKTFDMKDLGLDKHILGTQIGFERESTPSCHSL